MQDVYEEAVKGACEAHKDVDRYGASLVIAAIREFLAGSSDEYIAGYLYVLKRRANDEDFTKALILLAMYEGAFGNDDVAR